MDWEANERMWLLNAAGALARGAHHGQVDKAGRDYFAAHLADVERRVSAAGGSAHERAAALLHDVLEDTATTVVDLLEAGMPLPVVTVVQLLTKRRNEVNGVYYARIAAHPPATVVKLADVGSNTDPVRMTALDEITRERLTVKYRKALFALAGRGEFVDGQPVRLRRHLSAAARTLAVRLAAQLDVVVVPVCVLCERDAVPDWGVFCGEVCFEAHDEEFARDVVSGRFDDLTGP